MLSKAIKEVPGFANCIRELGGKHFVRNLGGWEVVQTELRRKRFVLMSQNFKCSGITRSSYSSPMTSQLRCCQTSLRNTAPWPLLLPGSLSRSVGQLRLAARAFGSWGHVQRLGGGLPRDAQPESSQPRRIDEGSGFERVFVLVHRCT